MISLIVAGATRPALIDDADASLARYRWRLSPELMVFRHGDKVVRLSHQIAGRPAPGYGVAHADGDRMNFCRDNLIFEPLKIYSARAGASKRAARLKLAGQGELSFG